MKFSKMILILGIAVAVGVVWTLLRSMGDKPVVQVSLEKLSVGMQTSPAMALVMVAEDMGFFDRAGVDVEIKEFTAGKFALQAFLGGSLDIAISGEVPVALSSLQGNQFRVIGQVVERTINECRVVARVDGNLNSAPAYFGAKKRRLATSFGGGPEFFTHNFLEHFGIPLSDVELISQKPEDMPAALTSGSVDAISIFDPFARLAERQLGASSITFADSTIYSELYVVNAMQSTIDTKRALLVGFMKGLIEAQGYVLNSPDESKLIVMKYTKLERQIVDDIWPNFVFRAALKQQLIDYTTAEAKWAIAKGTFPADTEIPNFKAIVYPDILGEVAPSAVSIRD